jgi:deazaflavin-dependent oxidoreductase (nitroreductase family)
VNPYKSALLRWARHTSFIPFVRWVAGPLDKLTRRTGRPFSTIGTGLPTVYLTTTGHQSGRPRTVPVFGIELAGGVGVIASNIGQNFRPAWYYNLVADPRCRVQQGREISTRTARVASAEERDELWRRALETYPAWQNYADRVDRELDMFVLEPG